RKRERGAGGEALIESSAIVSAIMRGRGARMSNPDAVSIDSVIEAMYETISGPKGQPRQWERDRALHHPKALLIPARQATGGPAGGVFSFDEFVATRAPFFAENDFYEIEI